MGQTPRLFTREFKFELMQQWASGDVSCASLCRQHQVSQSVLYRWRDDFRTRGDDAFTKPVEDELVLLRRRVADLEQLVGRVTMDNQVLKRGLQLSPSRNSTP